MREDFCRLPPEKQREILLSIDPAFEHDNWPGQRILFWAPGYRPGNGRYFPAAWRGGRGWITEAELAASIGDLVQRAKAVAAERTDQAGPTD